MEHAYKRIWFSFFLEPVLVHGLVFKASVLVEDKFFVQYLLLSRLIQNETNVNVI